MHRIRRVAANGIGPGKEHDRGGVTPEGAGWKDWLPWRLTLRSDLKLSLRGSVERQAQLDPDRLNKPEPDPSVTRSLVATRLLGS